MANVGYVGCRFLFLFENINIVLWRNWSLYGNGKLSIIVTIEWSQL